MDDVAKEDDELFDGGDAQAAAETDSPVTFPIGLREKNTEPDGLSKEDSLFNSCSGGDIP
ncbi:MAG: hypothetical protein DDG59_06775 [Anaerolineae bacterium]|nr:MAG: hypothetical protein DDG59_06775 [Anaerolineae bacterium]